MRGLRYFRLAMRTGCALLVSVSFLAAAGQTGLDRARALFERTQYEVALKIASGLNLNQAAVQELIGKSYYMTGDFKKATDAFQKAVALDGRNSVYYHWLGRSWGRRAETSSLFTAPGYASKARQAFEKAVELDGSNTEAVNDLFEYYLEAPGILGGGLDKAAALAQKIRALDPVEYHYAMAQIAERRKDARKAEQHFRTAMQMAPTQVGRAIDLAKFLARHGRYQESEAAFAQAEKIAPDSPRLLFERANAYVKAGKNLDAARELLQKYLRSPLSPGDPPREEALKLLKEAGA